jgi:hypothetical protein
MATDWRSGFAVDARQGATVAEAYSEFQPGNLLVRILRPMV